MKDNLDKELKNHIREVFDNYDDASADAGWNKLRQKFPEEKKRRIAPLWWLSAAAVLLLMLGLWFFDVKENKPQQTVYHKNKTSNSENKNNTSGTGDKSSTGDVLNNKTTTETIHSDRLAITDHTDKKITAEQNRLTSIAKRQVRIKAAPGPERNINHKQYALNNTGKRYSKDKSFTYQGRSSDNKANSNTTNTGLETITENTRLATVNAPVIHPGLLVDTATTIYNTKIAGQQIKEPQPTVPSIVQKQDAVLNMIAADNARQQTAKISKKKESVANVKSVVFSVYAATYFNYAKGSSSDLNLGAGFTSDFKLNDNFKLSTGVAIAQNTLDYNSSQIPMTLNSKVSANIVSRKYADLSSSFAAVAASPSVRNYNASLIGLDIPLNVKYQLNPKKGDTYILAGISSGTFINETYRSTVAYPNYVYGLETAVNGSPGNTTEESTTRAHFSSFDFARTLNFSFGIGYPLGKYNRLIIEPFVKYPLSGLGAEDIRFGAGGINLKLNFKAGKK